MDKLNVNPEGQAREPYEPPVIEDVPLHADEQLLAGCKTGSNVTGGRSQPCRTCHLPVQS